MLWTVVVCCIWAMPVVRDLQMKWRVGLHHPRSHSLRDRPNNVVLQMTRLNRLPIACNERHIFTLFVLEADLPTSEKFWSRLDFCQSRVLEWSLQLTADHILKAVIGDDVVVCTLVLDGNGLLHQASFLELIAVNERPTEASLLIWGKTLGKVGVHLVHGLCLSDRHCVKGRVIEFIIGGVEVLPGLRDGGSSAFFSLSFGATGRIQCGLLLLRL